MALKLGIGSKTGVGVDIGSNSLKVLELSKSGRKYYIDALDIIDLHAGAVSGGTINDGASAASYLKSSFSKLGISEKKVAIGIPCKHVIIKTIEMPKMKPKEIDSSIYYEAQRYITYDMNEVFLDYIILGDSPNDAGNNLIMIVAGKKDIIENQMDFIHQCGLNPNIVDVDCIALENMFNFNYPEEFDELTAIIKIGASETNVHVLQKGVNLFRRDIPIGGMNITEEIAKKFQIDVNEAENIKTPAVRDWTYTRIRWSPECGWRWRVRCGPRFAPSRPPRRGFWPYRRGLPRRAAPMSRWRRPGSTGSRSGTCCRTAR